MKEWLEFLLERKEKYGEIFLHYSSPQQARTCLTKSQTSQIWKTLPRATENITFVPVQIIVLTFCQHCWTVRVAIKCFHFEKKRQLWAVQIWCKMCSLWFYWWKDFRIWGGCVRMQPINNRRRIREFLEFKKFNYQSQIFLCKTIHIVPGKLRQVPKKKTTKKHKKWLNAHVCNVWVKPVYGIVPNPHY